MTMSRQKTKLPVHVTKRISENVVVYAEGGNEYFYLKASKALNSFRQGTQLPSTALDAVLQNIKSNMSNDAISQIYWIVDGGDEHNQVKSFKNFYLDWHSKKHPKDEGKNPYWSKLKILINHPCLEYWFLLHKCDPPIDPKTNTSRFFVYDKKEFPSPCNTLQKCADYKSAFPNRTKGVKEKDFINEIATNTVARSQAIARAKKLDAGKPPQTELKTVLSYPCAEIYQLFEK